MSINTIFNLGDDQLASHFQIVFPTGIPGGGSGENIALRMDQAFDVPQVVTGEYDFYHKGMKITKPNMTDNTDKHVTLNVRIDQQWAIFDDIKNWKELVYNPREATRLSWDLVNAPVLIQALDGSGNVTKTIKLNNCVMKDYKISTFDPGGADPSRIEMVLIFGSIEY